MSFIANKDYNLEIAKGNITGHTYVHKFGKAVDFDTGDGFVTVWDGANDGLTGTGTAMQYAYSATANIDQLSSTSGSDTVDIEIQGLDTNWAVVTQTETLTGQTPVTITTALIRVFRMKNVGASALVGTVHLSINGAALTSGEPDALGDNRAMITIGAEQTLMAVYAVPDSKKAYIDSIHVSVAGAIKTSAHVFHLRIRPFGGVFQFKHTGSIIAVGGSHVQHNFKIPELVAAKSDIEIECDTDTNVAAVSAGFDLTLVDD